MNSDNIEPGTTFSILRSTKCQAPPVVTFLQAVHSKSLPPNLNLPVISPRFATLILRTKKGGGCVSGPHLGWWPPGANRSRCVRSWEISNWSKCMTAGVKPQKTAVTLLFSTLAHDALCFQTLARTKFFKPFRINTCKKQQRNFGSRKLHGSPRRTSQSRLTLLFSHFWQ